MKTYLIGSGKNIRIFLLSFILFPAGLVMAQNSQVESTPTPTPTPTPAPTPAPTPEVVFCKDQFLARFNYRLNESAIEKLKARLPAIFVERLGNTDFYLFKLPEKVPSEGSGFNVKTFAESLKKALDTLFPKKNKALPEIGGDYVMRTTAGKSRSGISPNITEDRFWGLKKIQADILRDNKFNDRGDPNIIIAVLDSGVDNQALETSLWRPQKSFTLTFKDKRNVTCGPETRGINFVPGPKDNVCVSFDDFGHGTKVAGVIASNGTGTDYARGISPNVQILPIKIFNGENEGCFSDVIRAWEFVRKINRKMYSGSRTKIRIINHSFGLDRNRDISDKEIGWLREAIKRAEDENLLLVASAGNSGYRLEASLNASAHFPANIDAPNLISVAASDEHDMLIDKSNWGAVDVSAPGVHIYTTKRGGGFTFDFDETSAAAPFVSGAAALVMSNCPWLTGNQVKKYLTETSDSLTKGVDGTLQKTIRFGRINVESAVQKCWDDRQQYLKPKN